MGDPFGNSAVACRKPVREGRVLADRAIPVHAWAMRWSDRLLDRVRHPGVRPAPAYRSDEDLHLFRRDRAIVVAAVPLSLWVWEGVDGRWATLPLFLLPIAILVAVIRIHHWRRRRMGKRFSSYDGDAMPGD